jgi:hypothetical protein
MNAIAPVSFPISDDDDVWVARFKGTSDELISVITSLLTYPEEFTSSSLCKVNKLPILKHLKGTKFDKRRPIVDRTVGDQKLKDVVMSPSGGRSLPSDLKKDYPNLSRCLLFDPAEPVTIFFQYGDIVQLTGRPPRAKLTTVLDEIIIQGEYGTNVVRVQCPVMRLPETVAFNLTTPMQITITPTNICYVHYDLNDEGAESIYRRIAKVALFPSVAQAALNRLWSSTPPNRREFILGADTPNFVKNQLMRDPNELQLALKNRQVEFRIAGLEGYRIGSGNNGLRYEFVFQAKSGRRPGGIDPSGGTINFQPESSPSELAARCAPSGLAMGPGDPELTSTCTKDVATLNPIDLYTDNATGTLYIYLESSQMMRWVLAGTSPVTSLT